MDPEAVLSRVLLSARNKKGRNLPDQKESKFYFQLS